MLSGYISFDCTICVKSCSDINQLQKYGENSCVITCDANQFIDLQGLKCVTSCGTYQTNKNGVCVCKSNTFLSVDGTQCLASCPSGQLISNNGEKCLTACPLNQFISLLGTNCVSQCSTN